MTISSDDGSTKVRFDLWLVLTFLVVLFGACFLYLFNSQAAIDTKHTNKNELVCERVTKLEAQYEHIIKGLDKVAAAVEKASDRAEEQRDELRNLKLTILSKNKERR